MILKYGKVYGCKHASLISRIRKLGIVLAQLITQHNPAFVFRSLLKYFLFASLNGKICLSQRDDLFSRIGVLDDEIAGIASKCDGGQFSTCAFSCIYHVVDINEMI
ncbi:hypothetical protein D3C74_380240 [compost metagenome]